jgi:hypothetical protein
VFAPIYALIAVIFLAPALPNGIQLTETSAPGDSIEIVAGYASGGLSAFPAMPAVRALTLTAYAAGGNVTFFNELNRTGLRITAPRWSASMFVDQLPALLKEVPTDAASPALPTDFRSRVETEIREALLGSFSADGEYATDKAFVLFPGPVPNALRDSLAAIPGRPSQKSSEAAINRLAAERTLRFKSDLDVGGVIFGAPAPAVYYQEWYSILLLDRVLRRTVPLKVASELQLTTRPYYYRIEVPVAAGQLPEPVEENLLQELQRLQLARAEMTTLEAARQDARAFLESKATVEWFASVGIQERRQEGLQWIQAMTADDVRVAARDLLLANRVVATWSPKPKQAVVEVEDLGKGDSSAALSTSASRQPSLANVGRIELPAFPSHTDVNSVLRLPEKLTSGVSLLVSNVNAVFVAGEAMTRYPGEMTAETLKAFQGYPPGRILVFSSPEMLDRTRQLWSSFKGNNNGSTGVARGNVSTGDLPALVILKTLVDRKLIEAGRWGNVELKISASEGSTLSIAGPSEDRTRIVEWIKSYVAEKPTDSDMAWAREVAVHRLGTMQADLQALIWERDPQGTLQDLLTVSSGHVQDVARIYF